MITKEDIKNLAALARLKISDEEASSLTSEIDPVLGYVSQIEAMDTKDAIETPALRNVMREDVITRAPGEYTEDLLSNAPQREKDYLKVKKILS